MAQNCLERTRRALILRDVAELLRPYPSEGMGAYPVSTVVNSPKNDTPECIEPLTA